MCKPQTEPHSQKTVDNSEKETLYQDVLASACRRENVSWNNICRLLSVPGEEARLLIQDGGRPVTWQEGHSSAWACSGIRVWLLS